MTSLLVMFGQRPIGSIDVPDVERYKVWRLSGDQSTAAVKSITLRHDLDAFSKFFEWAIRMGYATFNVVLRADATLTDISESESDHYEMLLRSPSAILYCLQPLQTQIRAQHQPASPRFRLLCYSSD
jgi:hypothetical protein